MKRYKVGFISLGCPKNLVDTESMMSALSDNSVLITGDETEADIVVINTCGFLEPAKQESMSTIEEFAEKKRAGQLSGLIVAGCMAERYLAPMRERFPEVDQFIRTGEFSKIVPAVEAIQENVRISRESLLGEEIPQLQGHSEMKDYVSRLSLQRPYAYVKISEGCNRNCSFCIIPKLRGKHHSRRIPGIVDEIQQLVENGTQEIIFIAQDLTSYGRDFRDGTSLFRLLEEVEKIEGLYWYRLIYNYPRFFSDDLIWLLANSQKFSGYLDIPFQHISASILKAMRRPESPTEILELISKLRSRLPRLSLRTTLMLGFPGETEGDFKELCEFIREVKFDHLGAFTYYRENDTPSFTLSGHVNDDVKQERYERLMILQKEIQKKKLQDQIGLTTEVMIDGIGDRTKEGQMYRGRHWGQAPEIDSLTYVLSNQILPIGSIVPVEIQRSFGDYDLFGLSSLSHLRRVESSS